MSSSSRDSFCSPLPPLDWKFSQVFGETSPCEDLQDVDVVCSIGFEKSGDYIGVGDRGGRVVIFEAKHGKHTTNTHLYRNELERLDSTFTAHPEYQYKTEFQSHEPEFDYLKSMEIEEKINRVKWCSTSNGSLFILSANDKTIKLWKSLCIGDLMVTNQNNGRASVLQGLTLLKSLSLCVYVGRFYMTIPEVKFGDSYLETILLVIYGHVWGTTKISGIFGLPCLFSKEVKEKKVKKVREMEHNSVVCSENDLLGEGNFMSGLDKPLITNGYHLDWAEGIVKDKSLSQEVQTKITHAEETTHANCRKVYAHAHDFNINSISNNSDGETFISSDDLRINLWNLEISDQCFNIIDMKPSNMEDLTEVITVAEFHPIHCNLLAYSSSRGFIRLVDMRQSALCDHSARILQDAEYHGSKSFFTELIASISDMKFTYDGQHILSRDYMNLKLWDMRMDSSPVAVFKIHEHLRPKNIKDFTQNSTLAQWLEQRADSSRSLVRFRQLNDLYNDDSIFDKFECCISGDGLRFATGSYSNNLRIFAHGVGNEEGITIEASKNPNREKKGDEGSHYLLLIDFFSLLDGHESTLGFELSKLPDYESPRE
ncbi:unnamed protein product [Dovyalis caffra]|uniref:Serine/threonine-protein phosphatase 2A 55 kDa regulatory subunit B n=1 Tax=Dovyalis caffra TaxID=77055 RepID=A0AAV1R774_9ROSI|nr:unnamed protein product [Dovyalis caffra]